MTSEKFIFELSLLAVSEEYLQKKGYESLANPMADAFFPKKCDTNSNDDNIILTLLKNYDLSSICLISPLSFFEKKDLRREKDMVLFGTFEQDLLAIHLATNEVLVLAYWDYDEISFRCAKDSASFLEAFLIGGLHYNASESITEFQYNAVMKQRAIMASEIAGGDMYREFWTNIFYLD